MPSQIARSPEAARDLLRYWAYLLENGGETIADRFLEAVETTSGLLLENPYIGTLLPSTKPKTKDFRRFPLRLPFGTWLIVYRPTSRGITILRVLHGKRDLGPLLP